MNKQSWCAWDSNHGPQDERCRHIHSVMCGPHILNTLPNIVSSLAVPNDPSGDPGTENHQRGHDEDHGLAGSVPAGVVLSSSAAASRYTSKFSFIWPFWVTASVTRWKNKSIPVFTKVAQRLATAVLLKHCTFQNSPKSFPNISTTFEIIFAAKNI